MLFFRATNRVFGGCYADADADSPMPPTPTPPPVTATAEAVTVTAATETAKSKQCLNDSAAGSQPEAQTASPGQGGSQRTLALPGASLSK